jgi:lysozyme family protein
MLYYQDFIIEEEFNNLMVYLHIMNESNEGEWVDDKTYSWDMKENGGFIPKLKSFLSKLPKEKIKKYFYKFIKKMIKLPRATKVKILIPCILVFFSFASIDYLTSEDNITNTDDKNSLEILRNEMDSLSNLKSDFKAAQDIVKEVEAGYSNDKKDSGNYINTKNGRIFIGTNHGISAQILAEYLGRTPTQKEMKNLDYETALKIYKNKYWDAQNLGYYRDQNVANIIYDGCVNQGINGMKKILREVYYENGINISDNENPFNVKYIKITNHLDQKIFFNSIKSHRESRYRQAKTFKTHGTGWLNRLDKFQYNGEDKYVDVKNFLDLIDKKIKI